MLSELSVWMRKPKLVSALARKRMLLAVNGVSPAMPLRMAVNSSAMLNSPTKLNRPVPPRLRRLAAASESRTTLTLSPALRRCAPPSTKFRL